MSNKDVLQIIVLRNGVEQFNITNPKAAVINVVIDLPEEKKNKSHLVTYGKPQDIFYAHRELDKETQKNILKGMLRGLDRMDEEDDEERVARAEASEARRN